MNNTKHFEVFLCLRYIFKVEYDLENSSKEDLVLSSIERMEQSATPLAMTWYPPLVKESFIITANDQVR